VLAFACPNCAQLVFFHNSVCLRCHSDLGFDPESRTMVLPDDGHVRCANLDLASCNWVLDSDEEAAAHEGLCLSCRLTRTRPDDDDPEALANFAAAETQKRRLVFQLLELGLPVVPYDEDTEAGLAFDLLSSRFDQVMIGHDDGLITLDLAESDDAHREQVRLQMGEAYRTVLGHFRHEIGHYYWDVLIPTLPERLEAFRELFGDESFDYGEALDQHYQQGPPADWADRFVSQYATMHPWEDWAETFAHYLHIRDALQTAASFGLQVVGPDIDTPEPIDELAVAPTEPSDDDSILDLVADWLALSYALNAMSRSLGNNDLYPFVLAPEVVDKLRFVHETVGAGAPQGDLAGTAA
jgi:hypothetical protein